MGSLPSIILVAILLGGIVAWYFQLAQIARFKESLDFLRLLKPIVPDNSYLTTVRTLAATSPSRPTWPRPWVPPGADLVAEHIQTVAAQRGQFDPHLMSDLTISREGSRLRSTFPAFLMSASIILGLGGTFLAFRSMLKESNLGTIVYQVPAEGRETSEEILKASSRLLPAFQIIYTRFSEAFYTSLVGIGTTVLLLATSILGVNPRLEELIAELEEFTSAVLVPRYSADPGSSKLIKATERAVEIVAAAAKSTANLEVLSASLVALTKRIEDSLGQNSKLGGVLDGVSKQLASTESRWKSLLEALDTSRLSMSGVVDRVQSHSVAVIGALKQNADAASLRLDAFASAMANEIKSVTAAKLEHFDLVSTTIHDASDRLLGGWREQSLASLTQQSELGLKLLQRAEATEKHLAEALAAHHGNLTESLTAHANSSVGAITQVASHYLQELGHLHSQREALEQAAGRAMAEMLQVVVRYEETKEEHIRSFSSTSECLAERWSTSVREASVTIDNAATRIVDSLKTYQATQSLTQATSDGWRTRQQAQVKRSAFKRILKLFRWREAR
jgi:hypothetical protein